MNIVDIVEYSVILKQKDNNKKNKNEWVSARMKEFVL